MKTLVARVPDEIVAVVRYHTTSIGLRTSDYLEMLIMADLEKNQPEMLKKVKKETTIK